jgi:tetratricopeptide (TPR) repeat protein
MRTARSFVHAACGVAALIALGSCATGFAPDRSARAPLLEGYGSVDMAITTDVPEARTLFLRGLLQTYAFDDAEAARAYRAALALDPSCTMCAWGVAKAAGPNINNTDRGDLGDARRHLAWARHHAERASERERALVEALSERYGPEPASAEQTAEAVAAIAPICGASGAAKADPLDIVYAARMRALADAYPDDDDILALYAEAAMIATRGDWWDKKTGAAVGAIGDVADRLERAVRRHPEHPALNHYLIHALDASPRPERALAAAERLGAIAPQAPHLVHMPSHIYVRIARYGDAMRVNEEAIAAQARENAALREQGFTPSNDWDGHDRHFLWFAALTAGRGELALEQARALAAYVGKAQNPTAEYMRSLPVLTLVRLERWDDILGSTMPAGDAGVTGPVAAYASGVALVRVGRITEARERSAALQSALDMPALRGKTLMADDPVRTVLEILARRLQGEIAVAEQRPDVARTALAGGGELETALMSSEPPLLGSMSRIALGDLMLRAGRWSDAEQAYRGELVVQPGNGWALVGLQQSLDRQGRSDEARRVRAESERAWAGADAALHKRVPG